MRTAMYITSILFVALTVVQGYQHSPAVQMRETEVSLCTLVAQPNKYAGKTVLVRATLVGGMEFQILKDDSCPAVANPSSGKSDLVEASFSRDHYNFHTEAHKKLTRLLKKKQLARVTIVGIFTDPGKYVGHQLCCRYELDIWKVLSVEDVSKSTLKKIEGRVARASCSSPLSLTTREGAPR
jgi:hypothetical protein